MPRDDQRNLSALPLGIVSALRANADLTEKATEFMADPEQIEEAKVDVALWRQAADELDRYEQARQEDAIRLDETLARIDRQASHIADLREGCYQAGVEAKKYAKALGEIEGKARWYADNLDRDPREVDHALCVEILDLAQRALSA